jgi:hypothetical protein
MEILEGYSDHRCDEMKMEKVETVMMLCVLEAEHTTTGDILLCRRVMNVDKYRKLTCSSSPCSEPCTRKAISCHFGQCVASRALLLHRAVRDGSKAPFRPCHTWGLVQLVPFW